MGQTKNVAVSTDFSSTKFSPVLSALNFTNAAGTTAVATFKGLQANGSEILPTMAVTGSAGINGLVFNLSFNTAFSVNYIFQNWDSADTVTINANAAGNSISGVSVAETINGSATNEGIFGSAGNDTINGGGGIDAVTYTTSAHAKGDVVDGGADLDTIFAVGSGTFDFVRTTISNVEMIWLTAVAGTVTANFLGSQFGGAGDFITLHLNQDITTTVNITGSAIDLSVVLVKQWSAHKHTINLKGLAAAANDIIGSDVNDVLTGGNKADHLDGGLGRDKINSSAGQDQQAGNFGNDEFLVNAATDVTSGETYDGGMGAGDRLVLKGSADTYDFRGASVTGVEVLVFDGASTVLMDSASFDPLVTKRVIGSGATTFDTLSFSGNDIDMRLVQFSAWDAKDSVLLGGTDAGDFISASRARDVMTGLAGADTFNFSKGTFGYATARDSITDFQTGIDHINLSLIDADGNAANGNTEFTKVDALTGAAGQLITKYDAAGNVTIISADINGDGKAELSIQVNGTLDFSPGATDVIL